MKNFPPEDAEYIRGLAALLKETGLSEIAVRRTLADGTRLSVRVGASTGAAFATHEKPGLASNEPEPGASGNGGEPAEADPNIILSPMVGTTYLSANPGETPFVQVGSYATKGQTLLVIEAMKTFNPIAAPRNGTIRRILVADGEPIEYGTPLLILE